MYDQLYDNAAVATWSSDANRIDWNLVTDYLRKNLPGGGRVLDFGCYSGGLLARLGAGYERHGVEINQAAARIASERADARIWASIDDIPAHLRFDAVIVSDVIEHMRNPLQTIERISSHLTERGMLLLTTGDADNPLWEKFGANWWYCFYPEHISFLSRQWLEFLHDRTGLSILHCENFRYRQPGIAQRLAGVLLAHAYGRFAKPYLQCGRAITKMLGRPGLRSVPGNGVSADHLLIVITRATE